MQLPFGFGELDWSDWVRGLYAAVMTSAAGAGYSGLGLMIADSSHFNPQTSAFWKALAMTSLVAGAGSFLLFIRTKPLPDKKVEKTVETKEVKGKPVEVVTTVKETTVEAVKPDSPKAP